MTSASTLRPLVVAVAILAAGSSQAAIQTFTDEASFLAALSSYATDTFDDLMPGQAYDGPLSRSAGSVGYTASTTPNSPTLYGAGSGSDAWLSSNNAADFIVFDGFSVPVYGAGAYVFGSDIFGEHSSTGITAVRVTNEASEQVVKFKFRADTTNYFGVLSDTPLTTFEVKTLYGENNITWPTVDDLTLAPVPEPGTYAMLMAGLAAVGFLARRRRR